MLVLLGRNFDAAALLGQLAATGGDLLVRVKSNRNLPVLRRYRDGSCLSQIGTLQVRVIECQITIATAAGRRTGACIKNERPPEATAWKEADEITAESFFLEADDVSITRWCHPWPYGHDGSQRLRCIQNWMICARPHV